MAKTLVITGGCGFIGTNIALHARKEGYKVTCFDSLIRPLSEENLPVLKKAGVDIVRGDVRNLHDLERLPKSISGLIHLGANPGIPWSINWPIYDFATNALGTLNVLEFSRLNGKFPVIFASTNKVYSEEINLVPVKPKGKRYVWSFTKANKKRIRPAILAGINKLGINEDFPMDSSGRYPHSPYGVSKATADLYCQEYYHIYDIPTVVNRMSCIYGLYQKGVEDQGWVDWFVRAKVNNQPLNIYGDGKQVRDALFGSDVAQLYLKEFESMEKVKGQVFNVGGGIKNTISLLEAIEHLNKKGGNPLKLVFNPWRAADQKIYISDISKVQKMLGWSPKVEVLAGIDKIWEMYMKEGSKPKLF